jgi:Tetratricopeptide repeat
MPSTKTFPVKRYIRGLVCAGTVAIAFGQAHTSHDAPPPIPVTASPLGKALDLIRQGQTDEARRDLTAMLAAKPDDPELYHQLARSCLTDFCAPVVGERPHFAEPGDGGFGQYTAAQPRSHTGVEGQGRHTRTR